jgi:hypothetical protein
MPVGKQGEKLKERADLRFHSRGRHGAKSPNHLQIFLTSEKRIEIRFLGNITEPLSIRNEIVLNILALEENLAASGLQQAGEYLYGGTFSRTIGAQVAEYLAGLQAKCDFSNRGHGTVELCESDCFEHGHPLGRAGKLRLGLGQFRLTPFEQTKFRALGKGYPPRVFLVKECAIL